MNRRLNRFHLWLALLLAAAAAIRIVVLASSLDWIVFRVPVLDAAFYHESALGLLAGEWPGNEPYFMGPLYSYLLGGLYALFGSDPLVGRVANLVVGLLTLLLVGVAARRVAGDVAALSAVAVGALYGPAIFYEQVLLLAALLTLTAVVMYERTLALVQHGGWRAAVPLGLALGAAAALRGSALLYLVPIAWAARRRLLGRDGVLLLVSAAVVLAPFAAHNALSGSKAILTTNLGWNLFIGNHGGARGTFAYPNGWRAEGDPTGRRFASQLARRDLDADETSAFWLEQARRAVRQDTGGAFVRLGRKIYLFLQSAEIPQNESYRFFLFNVPVARAAALGWWFLLPLGALGAAIAWRSSSGGISRGAVTTVLFALVPLAACVVFFVTGRYRLPAVPFLLILSGTGIAWIIRGGTRAPRRSALAIVLVLIASMGLLLAPIPYDAARALARDHEHVGLRYQRLGAMRSAEQQYRLALESSPEDGDALNNLGTVLMAQERVEEARDVFERAAKAQPENPVPLQNLAAARGRLQDPAGAEEALRRAVAIDPGNLVLWMNLGTSLALQEKFAEAVSAFERADRLDPGNPDVRSMLQSARDFLAAEREAP